MVTFVGTPKLFTQYVTEQPLDLGGNNLIDALVDDAVAFYDAAAPTKRARIDVGLVTAGQTRVITIPDRDITLSNRGSNANGEYVRLVDGTQICTFVDTTGLISSTAAGSLFTAAAPSTWTFPAAFLTTDNLAISGASAVSTRWASFGVATTTSVPYTNYSATTAAALAGIRMMAIGRWF